MTGLPTKKALRLASFSMVTLGINVTAGAVTVTSSDHRVTAENSGGTPKRARSCQVSRRNNLAKWHSFVRRVERS